jgi:hypothetical protein
MPDNRRIYDKKMRALERRTGTGFWDFRTLRMTYPRLADVLHGILIAEGIVDADVVIQKHYVPRRICNW